MKQKSPDIIDSVVAPDLVVEKDAIAAMQVASQLKQSLKYAFYILLKDVKGNIHEVCFSDEIFDMICAIKKGFPSWNDELDKPTIIKKSQFYNYLLEKHIFQKPSLVVALDRPQIETLYAWQQVQR